MSHHAPAIDPDLADRVSATHHRALEKVFQHPLSHNLSRREATRLFETIGTVEHRHNGDIVLRVAGEQLFLKPAHGKDLDSTEVMDLRHLLIRAGYAGAASNPVTVAAPKLPDVMIVVDHTGARTYALHAQAPDMAADETHHLRHDHISRKLHDADRDETYPADSRFFEAVAAAMPAQGRIVVVSHGTGESNEAKQLNDWLGLHRNDIVKRIVDTIVVDLAHLTVPQIARLARDALGTSPT
jgi:hypothetical protein